MQFNPTEHEAEHRQKLENADRANHIEAYRLALQMFWTLRDAPIMHDAEFKEVLRAMQNAVTRKRDILRRWLNVEDIENIILEEQRKYEEANYE